MQLHRHANVHGIALMANEATTMAQRHPPPNFWQQGKDVVFLCEVNRYFFGSFAYLIRTFRKRFSNAKWGLAFRLDAPRPWAF